MTEKSVEKIKAEQIAAEIGKLSHPFLVEYTVFEADPQKVARHLRMMVETTEVTVTVKGETLFVGTKQYRSPMAKRNAQLEAMVRKLAMSTDNDRLYDEAQALLGVI